jgi:YesN/AraC family two-component response regulator
MKRKSILLVDDEQIILDTLARDLTSDTLKFDVSLAASGEEAIARINADIFDLVVTDLIMPGLDGFQVLKAAKQKDPHTMVIVLTGYADLDAAVDSLRLRADDFLQKPCDFDELLYRISNCFVKQGLQRQLTFYEKILPVCAYCRKIRDDRQAEPGQGGHWYILEEYLRTVKGANVSHGCCPECFEKQMTDIANRKNK